MSAQLNAPIIDFPMTCDRPCMSQRGLLIQPGTEVAYLARASQHAVEVRMADGSHEVVRLDCFKQGRALIDLKVRAIRAFTLAASQLERDHIPGFNEAIDALPDVSKLARLRSDIRLFIETQFALIKAGE